jgi:hypothetical protein
MKMTEKVYRIYAKNKCIFSSVTEKEFKSTWETLQRLVGIMKTEYNVNDLTYDESEVTS